MDLAKLGLNPLPRKPGCTGRMGPEELVWMMRQAVKKNVPIEVRVRERLRELHAELNDFSEAPGNRFRTTDEWKKFRKLMRHGKRISVRFKDAEYKIFFSTLYDTATVHLRQGGHL